jgi:hypothetical protein
MNGEAAVWADRVLVALADLAGEITETDLIARHCLTGLRARVPRGGERHISEHPPRGRTIRRLVRCPHPG